MINLKEYIDNGFSMCKESAYFVLVITSTQDDDNQIDYEVNFFDLKNPENYEEFHYSLFALAIDKFDKLSEYFK